MIRAIGLSGAAYLFFLLVLAPAMSFRSAAAFSAIRNGTSARALPPLTTLYLNSLALLALLFALTWFTARTVAFDIFAAPQPTSSGMLAGVAVLCFQFAMQLVSHAIRTSGEREAMPVNRLVPRTAAERALYSVASIGAGIAEEAAYRGVLTAILSHALGSLWIATGISALAFALAHAVQGRKSMAVIFVMACAMQLLVWYTGTLVIAMVVHALYDLSAPTLRRRILREPPTAPERIAG